jgi:hypothetical protein
MSLPEKSRAQEKCQPEGPGGNIIGQLAVKPDQQIEAIRNRIARFKMQARVLLERFERGEISHMDARAEAERLGCEADEAERQVEKWDAERQRGN